MNDLYYICDYLKLSLTKEYTSFYVCGVYWGQYREYELLPCNRIRRHTHLLQLFYLTLTNQDLGPYHE